MGRLTTWLRRRDASRTVVLPTRGRAIVVSDLHGNLGDWRAILAASGALERIAAGEDLYLLITGDVPDVARHRALDPGVPPDGDVQILDELLAAKARLGEAGRRIVYLEGNHDYHVARICHEVAAFQARSRGAPAPDEPAPATAADYEAYCAHYVAAHGQQVFENNVVPYDMVPRARLEHLRLLTGGPVLAVLPGARALVTHAGPPRMAALRAGSLKRQIDASSRAWMRSASLQQYYASPYHQLLNGRFRSGDYDLADVDAFLAAYDAGLLVTGHTPHPYLLDLVRREPIDGCSFANGLGLIGRRQVVLCSSFGALRPDLKRFLELDLARPYDGVEALIADPDAVRPVHPNGGPPAPVLPGSELIAG